MKLINIKSLTLDELERLVLEWGEPRYRAAQLYHWLQVKKVFTFAEMTNLSQDFRERLEKNCRLSQLEIIASQRDEEEGTVKYLFGLADGERVEAVYMPAEKRYTLCVSSQVGCKYKCRLCLTGGMGFTRDLEASEILEQIDAVEREQGIKLTNLVFMGMGEPLDNFAELTRALKILSDSGGRGFSLRRVTVSTIGLVDKVEELLSSGLNPNFTFSLNASTEAVRGQLMPINKKYPLARIVEALNQLPLAPRRRFTIAYVLVKGLNDSVLDAERLAKLLPRKKVKINLIPFNIHPGLEFFPPDDVIILEFQQKLINAGFSVFIRHSRGLRIKGACGQLAAGREDGDN